VAATAVAMLLQHVAVKLLLLHLHVVVKLLAETLVATLLPLVVAKLNLAAKKLALSAAVLRCSTCLQANAASRSAVATVVAMLLQHVVVTVVLLHLPLQTLMAKLLPCLQHQ